MDPTVLQFRMNRIEGYCDLGMWEDAEQERAALGTLLDHNPAGRELKLRILMGTGDWPRAVKLAMDLANEFPEQGHWFTHTAYCLHELGRTQEAREFLMTGPSSLKDDPLFYYNLACYECMLGRLDEARLLLGKAIERDAGLAKLARTDPDLKGIGGG